ncbi:MAG: hypothetical protein Q8R69_25040 [Telluria sp.]|nr:hypothetical protein [Telluria sp.]
MRTVETKLADWHRLYKELAQAQTRLAQGDALPSASPMRSALEEDVARLRRDCDAALDVVHTLIHGRRVGRGGEPRHQQA